VIEDIEGTAVFAGLNGGTASNWKIFGNTITHSASYIANSRGSGHNFGIAGIVFVANDASNNNHGNNFQVFNNTMYRVQGTYSGVVIQSGTGNIVQNNVWYGSVRTNNSFSGTLGYNWYYSTTPDDSSSTKVVCTTNCNIFTDAANGDFRLAVATSAGTSLSAPFNVDPSGVLRGGDGGWDRGAYEYTAPSAPTPPAAPTNVRIIP
jgi:hypothetical protein